MTKRLEILQNSLIKKEVLFDEKLQTHFDTVAEANGQPLNDKRNGQATLNKWDRQSEGLRNLKESIAKTENAIEEEKSKIIDCEGTKNKLPTLILLMLEKGTLNQWRRHPNTFFVNGVDKARLCWDDKKKVIAHKYIKSITDKNQFKIFAATFNELYKAINLRNNRED